MILNLLVLVSLETTGDRVLSALALGFRLTPETFDRDALEKAVTFA